MYALGVAAPARAEVPVELKVGQSSLGSVVTTAQGRTVYMFDRDVKGSAGSAAVSNCSGACLAAWPAVTTTSEQPRFEGVAAGAVGTIVRADGSRQVTLNGYPLYLWKDDVAAGDVKGQGLGNVWWALDPNGTPIKSDTVEPPVTVEPGTDGTGGSDSQGRNSGGETNAGPDQLAVTGSSGSVGLLAGSGALLLLGLLLYFGSKVQRRRVSNQA